MRRVRSMQIGTLQLALLHLLVLCIKCQENQTCTDIELNAYKSCVRSNPCVCSRCDANPLDDDPVISINEPPQNCQDISRLLCPLIRCCSPCADEARAWYGCTLQGFAFAQLGESCPTTCSGFDFLDVEGDCEPTPSPTAHPTTAGRGLCGNEVDKVDDCVANSTCNKQLCVVDTAALDATSEKQCEAHDSIVCPLVECCDGCKHEISSLSKCIQAELPESNGQCYLSCSSSSVPINAPPSSLSNSSDVAPTAALVPTIASSVSPTAAAVDVGNSSLPPNAPDRDTEKSGCFSSKVRVRDSMAIGLTALLSVLL